MLYTGLGVSPGVVVGKAYCIHEIFINPQTRGLAEGEAQGELARFEEARVKTETDLHALFQKVSTQVGPEQAAIFRTHQTILNDPALVAKIRTAITEQHAPAEVALQHALSDYTALFERTDDDYLRERLGDLRDVIIRLSSHLSPLLHTPHAEPDGPLILVAGELLPSQVVALGQCEVIGVVTQAGGQTSHAAILARSRGIPAVSGVPGILKHVKNGDTLVIDGRGGRVLVNPDPESESAYRKLQREYFELKDALVENRDRPALTADGVKLDFLANINSVEDARKAAAMGAAGVGLFRTEYLFLTHPDVPDEEEQLAAYRAIITASPGRRVTIRTLDLGGDKTIPYLGHDREANPFMGWRSIRLSFEHPQFFQTQIRAVLRAAAEPDSHVRLMFPMVTTLEEINLVRRMVRHALRRLRAEGKPYGRVPIGLMLEVPAAAIMIDRLLHAVDFVSIGSNDLVQYLMAADRDNPKVSHLCQPLSPAVLRVLTRVIRTCRRAGKTVTLCGEMAGQPRAFLLLLGMGLRSFSMSPAFLPTLKDLASHLSTEECRHILRQTLRLRTTGRVSRYLGRQIERLAPSLRILDSP